MTIPLDRLLAEKSRCVGGSDAASLFNLPPYGCERKLWYSKKGLEEDFPFLGNTHTFRGQMLEDIAAAVFSAETGRVVRRCTENVDDFVRHPVHPVVGSHPDFYQTDPSGAFDGEGTVQIKCPSIRSWLRIKAEGCPAGVHLQAQWDAVAAGRSWTTCVFFHAEFMKSLSFDYRVDPELAEAFGPTAEGFWAKLDLDANPFDRLPDDDRRCQTCSYRLRCKNLGEIPQALLDEIGEVPGKDLEEDESLAGLVDSYIALRAEAKLLGEGIEDVKEKLTQALKGRKIRTSKGNVWLSVSQRKEYTVKAQTVHSLKVIAPKAVEEESEWL